MLVYSDSDDVLRQFLYDNAKKVVSELVGTLCLKAKDYIVISFQNKESLPNYT